jgi:hypothetical protein
VRLCSAIKPNGERCRGIVGAESDYRPALRRAKASAGGPPLRPPRASLTRSSRASRTSFQALAERVLSGELERVEAAVVSQVLSVGLQENSRSVGRSECSSDAPCSSS